MALSDGNKLTAPSAAQDNLSFKQQTLLKLLLKQLDSAVPSHVLQQTEETVYEVIIESDIDGICYYLVRSRPKSNNKILLSPRERAIAELVAQGLPNKCIAKQLNISAWTVATHLRRIFAKLEVNSRTAMVRQLMEKILFAVDR